MILSTFWQDMGAWINSLWQQYQSWLFNGGDIASVLKDPGGFISKILVSLAVLGGVILFLRYALLPLLKDLIVWLFSSEG